MTIVNGQVGLRRLDASHMARTREWVNDPETARLMGRAQAVSEAEHRVWFASIVRRPDCAFFAVEAGADRRHVGDVWLWNIDDRHRKAELRIVIGEPSARDRGVGTSAIDMLCRHGFDELELHRIYAYVLAINPRGRRAFERAGFTLEGTLKDERWSGDRFVDTYLLARIAPPVS